MNKQDIIKQIKKTIERLKIDPRELDTITALENQILSIMDCIHGKIGKKVNGCNSCGYWVECSNKKIVANRVKESFCKICEHKEIDNLTKL